MIPRSDEGGQALRQALGFERHMYRRALDLTGAEADAADLVQDTFEQALRRWHRLKPGTDVRLWLMKVMAGVHAGRQRASPDPDLSSLERLPSSAALVSEPVPLPAWKLYSMRDVTAALRSMPPPLAEVCRMRMLQHLPTDAIVEKLHIPRPTVSARLHRGMNQLRSALTHTRDR